MPTTSDTGLPAIGPQTLQVARGIAGFGLAFAGTAALSGASILTTSQKKVTFNTNAWASGAPGRVPVLMRVRGVSATCAVAYGNASASTTLAADTWSEWQPCYDLYLGKQEWYVTGGGTANLEYEILYV